MRKRFLYSVLGWNVLSVRKIKDWGSNLIVMNQHGVCRMLMVRHYQWYTRLTLSLINEIHYFHCRQAYILLIRRPIWNKQRWEERAGELLWWKATRLKAVWWTRLWILILHVMDLSEHKLHPSIMSKTWFFPSYP